MGRKLIILGNGFDLASGLKSSYYDFFLQRISPQLMEYFDYSYNFFKENFSSNNRYWFDTFLNVREHDPRLRPFGKLISDSNFNWNGNTFFDKNYKVL